LINYTKISRRGQTLNKIIKKIAGFIIPYNIYLFLSRNKYRIKQMLFKNQKHIKNGKRSGLSEREKTIGKCWDNQITTKKIAWWQSNFAKRHINMLVNNVDSSVFSAGLHQLLLSRLNGKHLKVGVSVGCGSATKELKILEMDFLDKFILFELSEERIKQGMINAEKKKLQNRVGI
jgi:hypothetical protein